MTPNAIETYIKNIVSNELKKKEIELKEDEAKQIVKALIPTIDDLISKRIKSHFVELADFIKEKCKET